MGGRIARPKCSSPTWAAHLSSPNGPVPDVRKCGASIMPIKVTCPECGQRSKAPDDAPGKLAKCPRCPVSAPEERPSTEETGKPPTEQ